MFGGSVLREITLACRCDGRLWQACLAASVHELGERPWWLRARKGGRVQPSRVAMTYLLLHEQDLASVLFKALPTLWQLPSLQAVEQEVFGSLNHL